MHRAGVIFGMLILLFSGALGGASAASSRAETSITAMLDGYPIKPEQISRFYCHDFAYPVITCFRTASRLAGATADHVRANSALAATAGTGDYVTIFDGANFSGTIMNLSQNYDALAAIGWNDRISSFQAHNSASGTFWTDWFATGTPLNFCCNSSVGSIGSYDNQLSSVYRH